MFETAVMPYLMKLQNCVLYSKVLRVFGMGECLVVEKIKEIIENQDNPTIAPYAKEGEVLLRITARADNKELAEGMIALLKSKSGKNLENTSMVWVKKAGGDCGKSFKKNRTDYLHG